MKLIAVLLSWFFCCSGVHAVETTKNSRIQLYGQIDIVNSACGAAGVTLSSKQFPCKVEKVRLGSQAAYSGLMANDTVLKAEIQGNKLNILFQRGANKYAVKLNTSRDPIVVVEKKVPEQTGIVKTKMDKATALKLISQNNIIFIVDHSGSMGETLTSDKDARSKWGWCQDNISQFAREIGPLIQGGQLHVILFDDKFETFPNRSPSQVEEIFKRFGPSGGTMMAAPLAAGFQQHFSTRIKPVLIVVLTDGMPGDTKEIEKSIIAASQKLNNSGEMKIRFLEIGEGYQGGAFLEVLDKHLLGEGAQFDIVDYASFDEVKDLGLARAMVAEVSAKKQQSGGTASMEQELESLRRQIDELQRMPTK